MTDNKKLREECMKYENKIKTVKGESEKFKESLRNILL